MLYVEFEGHFSLDIIPHIMKANAFGCLQVGLPARAETSALVSMFRGIGIDHTLIPLGRGLCPVGQ